MSGVIPAEQPADDKTGRNLRPLRSVLEFSGENLQHRASGNPPPTTTPRQCELSLVRVEERRLVLDEREKRTLPDVERLVLVAPDHTLMSGRRWRCSDARREPLKRE